MILWVTIWLTFELLNYIFTWITTFFIEIDIVFSDIVGYPDIVSVCYVFIFMFFM